MPTTPTDFFFYIIDEIVCIIPGIKKQGDIVDIFFLFVLSNKEEESESPSGAEDRERMRRDDRRRLQK